VRFIWDPEKERRNETKHGLDFSLAEHVFADPLCVLVFDRVVDGEERWHCVGAVAGGLKILLVVHVYPDEEDPDLIRIIGLREATRHERRRYEDDA
jgi:uncharacterized protein